ncbi:ribokinase [Hyphodiscus hymeniophilus]|uniref:Ribokinase n=1 Tax=Hyphodiscus hymeniophilus TaxID=353542 RepID=A0A9P7B0Q3_9HELO|nr:ribokinase [Hyphodiscus hymeniophilus]
MKVVLGTPHICVIGSLNIDFVTYTSRCPEAGETLTARSLSINAGGKGANQAVACGRASFSSKSRQDVTVSMIGAVGADDPNYATLLKSVLERSGVSTRGVEERKDCQTGSATIIVEEGGGGENRILVVPGANHSGMSDVESIYTKITNNNQQPSPEVVVLQGEIPRQTVLGLLRHFNVSGSKTRVVFNAAPVFPEGTPLSALKNLAVLIMNETETMQLAASVAVELRLSVASGEELELKPAQLASFFHDLANVKIVLITLGAKGVFFSTETGRQGFVNAVKVKKVADTTAAGDTFVGYFATAFAKFVATGLDLEAFDAGIEDVVEAANSAAAMCVQRIGAMKSIPFAYE